MCKNCTESSLTTYYYNIKALAKMAGHDEPPNNHRWISGAPQENSQDLTAHEI